MLAVDLSTDASFYGSRSMSLQKCIIAYLVLLLAIYYTLAELGLVTASAVTPGTAGFFFGKQNRGFDHSCHMA